MSLLLLLLVAIHRIEYFTSKIMLNHEKGREKTLTAKFEGCCGCISIDFNPLEER